jgi:hypothetical protein
VIPSDASDELESVRLRKTMHRLAGWGAVVASITRWQPILDRAASKPTGTLKAAVEAFRAGAPRSDGLTLVVPAAAPA